MFFFCVSFKKGIFRNTFACSSLHSQPWWLPQLHPGSSHSPKIDTFSLQNDRRTRYWGKTQICLQRHRNSLWVSVFFNVTGSTEKTSVTRSGSLAAVCYHMYKIDLPLGLKYWRLTFERCQIPPPPIPPSASNFNPFKFSSSYWHGLRFVCFIVDKVVTLLLILTKGRDCICWKLLLECPKAL